MPGWSVQANIPVNDNDNANADADAGIVHAPAATSTESSVASQLLQPTFPFEYCALKYLLQWTLKEESIHRLMRDDVITIEAVRRGLHYFKVDRGFRDIANDRRATRVLELLRAARAEESLTTDQQVIALADAFKTSVFKTYNLSAASKLIWLCDRKAIIIDKRARIALERLVGRSIAEGDYSEYCKAWRAVFRLHARTIKDAADALPSVQAFLPGACPKDTALRALAGKRWFQKRVMDIWLWEGAR